MSEKRLNNTIFLMYLVTENYRKRYDMSVEDFLEFDRKYDVINYVAECPDLFDSMSDEEMVREVDTYVSET